jgi:hypothetical protein
MTLILIFVSEYLLSINAHDYLSKVGTYAFVTRSSNNKEIEYNVNEV